MRGAILVPAPGGTILPPLPGLLVSLQSPSLVCPVTRARWSIQAQAKAAQTPKWPLQKAGIVGAGFYHPYVDSFTHTGLQINAKKALDVWLGSPSAGMTVLWVGTSFPTDTAKTRNFISWDDNGNTASQFVLRYEGGQFQFVCNNGGGTYLKESKAIFGDTNFNTAGTYWIVIGEIYGPAQGSTIRVYAYSKMKGLQSGSTTLSLGTLFNPTGNSLEPPVVVGGCYQQSNDNNNPRPAQSVTHLAEIWSRRLTGSELRARIADPFAIYRRSGARFDHLFPLGTLTSDGKFLELQVGGTAPADDTLGTGWHVDGLAAGNYSRMAAGVVRATSTFSGTAEPSSGPDDTLGDCFRTENPWDFDVPAGDWTVPISFVASAADQEGASVAARVRMWYGPNADGSGATELTSGAVEGTACNNLQSEAPVTSVATLSLGAVSFTAQYLFLQVALKTL